MDGAVQVGVARRVSRDADGGKEDGVCETHVVDLRCLVLSVLIESRCKDRVFGCRNATVVFFLYEMLISVSKLTRTGDCCLICQGE